MTVLRVLIPALAAVAFVAACDRDRDRASTPPAKAGAAAKVTPADAGAPFAFESKTPFANVSLTIPQAVKGQPDLHARLYAAAVRDLRQFTEGAQADRTEEGGDGGMPPYEKTIEFADAVETARLFSLTRLDYDFTGGAHGNTLFSAVIWDKPAKRPIAPAALFRSASDLAALDSALCDAVNVERRRKDPTAVAITALGSPWACPKASATPFVLAPSATPGKAGGLTFLIGPYQVGPYAEGAHEVTLPQAAIRPHLAPAYVDQFAGEPVDPAAATTA